MPPLEGIEPGPLINLWFQVQQYPFSAKTETLGSLYSHALLIIAKSSQFRSKSKNQVVYEQKFKDPLSSTCQISPERIVLNLESEPESEAWVRFPFPSSITLNLHNIARSDRIGFKTKNPHYTSFEATCNMGSNTFVSDMGRETY